MAFSAHSDPEQVKERFADEKVVEQQAAELAQLIKQSKHFVAFTGAGVSTAAGIPDFRGPQGVWTMRAQGKKPVFGVSTTKAAPTLSHMSLVALQHAGYLKFLISQNCDGLHRRSGFPPSALAELHGNSNLEICRSCGREYLRDFECYGQSRNISDHRTGRICECGEALHDSIIHFGEDLPEVPLEGGFANCKLADLVLVLGSSLTVTPAADMPRSAWSRSRERGAKLVICNLQKTPLDSLAKMRVFAKTDDFMARVMRHLGLGVPDWQLKRWVEVSCSKSKDARVLLRISGIELNGTPASIFSRVAVSSDGVKAASKSTEPFVFDVGPSTHAVERRALIKLRFMGHYNEPSATIAVDDVDKLAASSDVGDIGGATVRFELGFYPLRQADADGKREWSVNILH